MAFARGKVVRGIEIGQNDATLYMKDVSNGTPNEAQLSRAAS